MDIHESLQHVLRNREIVGSIFYDVFFERCPEARSYFASVDLKHQATLLTMALLVIEAHFAHGYPATTAYLRQLGYKHHTRKVRPELYRPFGEALLATLELVHSSGWDSELARQWREAIERTSKTMLLGYQQPIPE
jgi:hemoglobin-like flavoprotein